MSAIWYDHAEFRCPTCRERVRLDGVQPFHRRLRLGQRFECPGCGVALSWARAPVLVFQLGQGLLALAFVALFVPRSAFVPVLILAVASMFLGAGMLMQRPVPLVEDDGARGDATARPGRRPSPRHPELDEREGRERPASETGLEYERGSAWIRWGARRIACGGPVHHALACAETGLAAVLIEAGLRPEALELYAQDGEPTGRWAAPAGFAFYTLQQTPSLTPGFIVVCIPTDAEESDDWQFRINLAEHRLERYSPWR